MDKSTLEKMATSAFENMTKARAALFTATEITIMEKYLLEEQRAAAMTSGVFDGKNAEIRDAQAREHLQPQYLKLAHAENAERAAEHRNEAEKGGAKVEAEMIECGNCGVPRFVHGAILEACPNCGDDETDLSLIDEVP